MKLTISECRKIAKDLMLKNDERMRFNLCGSKGKVGATWHDPYLGIFTIDGEDGFMMMKDIKWDINLWCEINMEVGKTLEQ